MLDAILNEIRQRFVAKELIQLAGDVKAYIASNPANSDDSDGENKTNAKDAQPAPAPAPPPEHFTFAEHVDSTNNFKILERAAKLIYKE